MKHVTRISKNNKCVIMCIHSPELALEYSDVIFLMKNGKIISDIDVHTADITEINEKMSFLYSNINVVECADANGRLHKNSSFIIKDGIIMNNFYMDASAVLNFYNITGKKHLFITGCKGSGKSTLLNNLCVLLNENFDFLRSYKTMKPEVVIKSNLIENAREYTIGTPLTANPDSLSKGNNMKAVQEGFLKCAIPAIRSHIDNSNNRFFVIDELGYLESSCIQFQTSIFELLNSSHVLAVIRKQSTSFLDKIRSRKDVLLIDIDTIFNNLSCIIMASGMSKRFGHNKLTADFNGKTLIENAISESRFVNFKDRIVVTRHNDVADICRHENIHFIKHDMPYRNDMIRIGVTHIINNSYSGGILFLPADQPLIKRTSLQLLCLLFVYHSKIADLVLTEAGVHVYFHLIILTNF